MRKRKYVKSGKYTKAKRRAKKDSWIQILFLLGEMSTEERGRCLSATMAFFDGR